MPIDEDYYKPIITRSAFNGNYIQYERKGKKGKNLSIKKNLNIIKSHVSDIINYFETHGLEIYSSGDKTWVEKTLSEWKIQLTIAINFISSKDSDETRTMHTKSNDVEIMVGEITLTVALNYEQTKDIQKEYQILSLLFINTIGKR